MFRSMNERTIAIPTQNICTTSLSPSGGEYSLKQNCFDPSKSSPPNTFMIKLHMRMNQMNSNYLEINDCNRESE